MTDNHKRSSEENKLLFPYIFEKYQPVKTCVATNQIFPNMFQQFRTHVYDHISCNLI